MNSVGLFIHSDLKVDHSIKTFNINKDLYNYSTQIGILYKNHIDGVYVMIKNDEKWK